jgi:hypothetical protein
MLERRQSEANQVLEAEINNRDAINSIMELMGVDEHEAQELWKRFIESVKKLKAVDASSGVGSKGKIAGTLEALQSHTHVDTDQF